MKFHQVVVFCILTCFLATGLCVQPARAAPDEAGFALLVDVSDYRDADIPPLRWKSMEVDKIRDALYSAGGFPESQVHVLAGEDATRDAIMESFTALVESAKTRSDARFFLYVKGRSLKSGDRRYFLPYNARYGATSTYIGEDEMDDWLDQIRFSKALIQATWDVGDQDDGNFSSALADLLRDPKTDADRDRKVTLEEIRAGIRRTGPSEAYPIRTLDDDGVEVVRLPSVLMVTSEPSGATILLDDVEAGVTPAPLTDLKPGTHRLQVKADRYLVPAEQTIEIRSDRGHWIMAAPYQLTPIKVHGTVDGVDKGIMRDVEAQIQSTSYRQAVAEDGSFSFEERETYGLLLEPGETYEILAQSRDGLYSGKAAFTFSGTEDIQVTIPLAQSNWTQVAERYLTAGNKVSAVAVLDAKLRTSETGDLLKDEGFKSLKPAIAQVFLTHLEGKLASEPDDVKGRVVAAKLADLLGDIPAARRHWKTVRAGSARETEEYKTAAIRLRQTSPLRQPRVVALLIVCAVVILAALVTAAFYVRRRIRLSRYREIPNPYMAGRPIRERDMFFGREDVFAFIKDRFSRNTKDIHIVLCGDRRTGKTSILHQIVYGQLGEDFIPVLIDIQLMAGVDTHDFFRIIAQKVNDAHKATVVLPEEDRAGLDKLHANMEDKSKSAYQSFTDFLTRVALTLEGKYIIFLIDEYELLEKKVEKGHITDEIYTYLRGLMQMDNLAFIFSGSRKFEGQASKKWAFMLNMAEAIEVSFLNRKNAIALITEPVGDYMQYKRKALALVLRLTAGHPYFTQSLCSQIVEDMNDKQQNRVKVEYVDEACHDVVENPPPHLAHIWGELTSEEKIMVALLADALPDKLSYVTVDDIILNQSHYGLESDRASISKAVAQLMIKEYLVEEKPGAEAYRFRMDLIRSWLQSEHTIWGVLKEVENNA